MSIAKQYVVIRFKKRGEIESVATFEDREKALDYFYACVKNGHRVVISIAERDPQPPAPVPVQASLF